MNNDNNIEYQNGPRRGKVLAGIVLLLVGASLLLKQFDFFFFPSWLFSWPSWVIVWGVYIGARHNFRNSSWIIIVLIGLGSLLEQAVPAVHIGEFFWPVAIIIFGAWLIVKRNNHQPDYWDKNNWKKRWDYNKYQPFNPNPANTNEPVVDYTTSGTTPPPADFGNPSQNPTGDDHLEAISIFGGVKKIIFSKNFQGGEIVNICGGSELDLTQADINGRVYIDVTQVFGGTKIIVPAHWTVVSDMAVIFAGVDDKRIRVAALDNNKVLVLKGTSIFAGVDIRSY